MTSREMIDDAMSESREATKQQILDKIQELKSMNSMSYLTGIIALQLVEVFIKFMDEE
jgi:hypothetical protein